MTLHVLVGNGDAHAENYSLLHHQSGALRLAPLYDIMCTLYYEDDRLATYIDDVRRSIRVTVDRIINEASSWGIPRTTAAEIVTDLLSRVPAAVEMAQADTPGLPAEIPPDCRLSAGPTPGELLTLRAVRESGRTFSACSFRTPAA